LTNQWERKQARDQTESIGIKSNSYDSTAVNLVVNLEIKQNIDLKIEKFESKRLYTNTLNNLQFSFFKKFRFTPNQSESIHKLKKKWRKNGSKMLFLGNNKYGKKWKVQKMDFGPRDRKESHVIRAHISTFFGNFFQFLCFLTNIYMNQNFRKLRILENRPEAKIRFFDF